MKKIDCSKLQPGDIVLTTSLQWESKLIRRMTDSDISHAMLCVASHSVMDSTGDGVHARNPQKLFYDDECAIHVLRLKSPLPDKTLKQVIDYVRAEHGAEYSLKEAIRAVTGPKGAGSQRQFCSRLVARAFSEAGVKLVEDPNFCTPAQLKASPLLAAVEGAVAHITDEEVAAWRRNRDGAAEYIKVSNALLDRARKISSKIGKVEEAIEYVVSHPGHDAAMAGAFRSSGYLDFWRKEIVEYPWRYDLATMLTFTESGDVEADVAEYCQVTLRHEEEGTFDHWKGCLVALKRSPLTRQLKTWGQLEPLYENLVGAHLRRVQTARHWLLLRKDVGNSGITSMNTAIDARTLQAYVETDYAVQGKPPTVLHVGQPSSELAALHKDRGVGCSVFITAWNPRGCEGTSSDNQARQTALAAELKSLGLEFIDGIGRHPSGDHPGEESFLVLGLGLDKAQELGRRFDQNAIIWCGADAAPQLVLLR